MTRKSIFLLAAASLALASPTFALAAPGPGPGSTPWLSINQREANLNARIDAGVRNRSLTAAEAASLRADLRTLEAAEASFRLSGGSLDMGERAELDRRFDALSARIRDQATDGQVGGSPWVSINQREANLNARIDAGVRDRSLTAAEAASLRADLRTLEGVEAGYRQSGGGLDAGERADLDRRFDALSARVRDQASDNQVGGAPWVSINQREANLNARIEAGIRNRNLTAAEAASLRADLRSLENMEASFRQSGGGLDVGERAELNRRFDALSARIRDQASDNQVGGSPFAQRESNMSDRIDTGARTGKLTPPEATDLRGRLEDIRRIERDAAVRDGLSPSERDDIGRRLDSLAQEIDRQIADGERRAYWMLPGWNGAPWTVGGRWQTIAQRQNDFNRIIDPAIATGRISRNESTYLHNEFNRLLNLERRYASGGISANERADLDRQFNILVQRVRAQATDNNNGRGTGPGRR